MSILRVECNSRRTILSLIGRGSASTQIAYFARDVAQTELQRRQLIEAAHPMLAHITFAPAFEQMIKVRRSAGACV